MRLFNHGSASKWSALSLLHFVDYTVINGTAAQIDNINAGGIDVPAVSAVTATLDDTELKAQLNNDPKVAVADVGALTTAGEMVAIARACVAIEASTSTNDAAFQDLANAAFAKITGGAASQATALQTAVDAATSELDLGSAAKRETIRRARRLEDMERLFDTVFPAAEIE